MLYELEKTIAEFISKNKLFDISGKILLAFSGGTDSTALIYAFCALRRQGLLKADLRIAHINHNLRIPEANKDRQFVLAKAKELNIQAVTAKINVRDYARKNNLSIETAARKLRIQSLSEIAEKQGCSYIVTAHQKNDNAETIIHRLLRGTGFRGLAGIWPTKKFRNNIRFVRPLLCVTREQIITYLNQKKTGWQTDHTNLDISYKRNFIRHRLLPEIQKQCDCNIVEQLCRLSDSARKLYFDVSKRADKAWQESVDCKNDSISLDCQYFSNLHQPVQVELIRRILVSLKSGEKDLSRQHYRMLLLLAQTSQTGKKITLPKELFAVKQYSSLIFYRTERISPPREALAHSEQPKVPGKIRFQKCIVKTEILENMTVELHHFKQNKDRFTQWFDLDKLSLPLAIRPRRPGDKFVPLGLQAFKKVGKFLTAQKITYSLRSKVLILADESKIIWVWPLRISDIVKVTPHTKKILQVSIIPFDDSGPVL